MEQGQRAGTSPRAVAQTVLQIIRTNAPARYYLVGSGRWYSRLARIMPPSAVESLMARRFQLAK